MRRRIAVQVQGVELSSVRQARKKADGGISRSVPKPGTYAGTLKSLLCGVSGFQLYQRSAALEIIAAAAVDFGGMSQ